MQSGRILGNGHSWYTYRTADAAMYNLSVHYIIRNGIVSVVLLSSADFVDRRPIYRDRRDAERKHTA